MQLSLLKTSLIKPHEGLVIWAIPGIILGIITFHCSTGFVLLSITGAIFLMVFFRKPSLLLYLSILLVPLLPSIGRYTTIELKGLYYSINIGGILNIGLTLLVLALLILRGKVSNHRLSLPISLFLGISLLSIIYSPSPFMSLRQWFRYAMPMMLYFLILEIFTETEGRRKILPIVLLSSIIPVFAGYYQLFMGDTPHIVSGLNRIYGTLGHPNPYATFLVVIMLLSIFLYFNPPAGARAWPYLCYFWALLPLLFFTYTRIAWGAFFLSTSLLGILRYRKFYFALFLAGILILLILPDVLNMLATRLTPDASVWQRFDLNAFAIQLFKESPIVGQGIGSYQLLSKSLFYTPYSSYGREVGITPHNDYLRFLSEVGILGLSAFLFMIYSALRVSFKVFHLEDLNKKNYGAFLISLIAAILSIGITDQGFEYASLYFFILLAIGESMLNRGEDLSEKD